MNLMNLLPGMISLGISLSFSWVSSASESKKLMAQGQWNERSTKGYNDVWGYTDEEGREYALLGVRNGTSVIDLSDPASPREISFIQSQYSMWKDIKTYKHYAYVVNEAGGGMQIIDLRQLPEKAELVATYSGFQTSHNLSIDIDQAMLYAEGNHMKPVRVLSLEDPLNPVEVNSLGVECHDIYAQGGVAYVSEGGHSTIGIFDTSDPLNVSLLKRFEIPNAGYVHNAWLNESGTHLMTTEETSGKTIKMWDISDLENVHMTSEYLAPGKLAHNTHIKGDFAYISHYGGGLRIVDVRDPNHIVETAYFTKTEHTPTGFVHVWGAYPFLKSGLVLISDIESGLYVIPFDGAKE